MPTLITTGRVQHAAMWKKQGWSVIDATRKSAKKAKTLAPSWDMIMGYKKGTMTEEEYTRRYAQIMKRSQQERRAAWENTLRDKEAFVILCYCREDEFCHRHLLAEEFRRFGEEELGMTDIYLLPEDSPRPPREPRELHHKHTEERRETTIDEPRYYAGVGSRETPGFICQDMSELAQELEEDCYVLRSGGAKGADTAFERGVSQAVMKDIILPKELKVLFPSEKRDDYEGEDAWAFKLCEKYVPSNRPTLKRMKPYIQRLLARDMMQILGRDGKSPVRFVVCWTTDGKDSGGTGYAIRCAIDHGIPVYNLYKKGDREALYRRMAKQKMTPSASAEEYIARRVKPEH